MTSPIKLLNHLLSQIFTENCRCFSTTCSIQTTDQVVNLILEILKDYQNPKACKTFFESSRIDYRHVFNKHLSSMIELQLLYPVTNGQNRQNAYVLADKSDFIWKNIMKPHQEYKCFCDPIVRMKKDFEELVSMSCKNRFQDEANCSNVKLDFFSSLFCTKKSCNSIISLTPLQLHTIAQCVFWYFRKAIVDNLLKYSYYTSVKGTSLQEMYVAPNIQSTNVKDFFKRLSLKNRNMLPRRDALIQSGGINLGWRNIVHPSSINSKMSPSISSMNLDPKTDVAIGMFLDEEDENNDDQYGIPDNNNNNQNSISSCYAVSVGSLNVTSDYDVTLYGTCVTDVIRNFYRNFKGVFGKSSNDVFDTNLYGSSFIEFFSDVPNKKSIPSYKFYARINCSPTPYHDEIYHYVVSPEKAYDERRITEKAFRVAQVQQRIFALLKLSNGLKHYVNKGVDVYNMIPQFRKYISYMQYMVKDVDAALSGSYESQTDEPYDNYSNYLSDIRLRIDSNSMSSPISPDIPDYGKKEYESLSFNVIRNRKDYNSLLNYVSVYNYFGTETYYTRGAFMHVVMQMQTCSANNAQQFDDLSQDCLIDSMMENLSDFIVHDGKIKYVKRIQSALCQLYTNYGLSNSLLEDMLNNTSQFLKENCLKQKVVYSGDDELLKKKIVEDGLAFLFEYLKDFLDDIAEVYDVGKIIANAISLIIRYHTDILGLE